MTGASRAPRQVNVEYLDLADFIAIAQAVTGLDLQTVMNVTNIDLADSALHAPFAGFGDEDFYPGFVDKAAVLLVRLARNHPLPDGNKRAAWVSLRLFVEINEWTRGTPNPRSTMLKQQCCRRRRRMDEAATAEWLRTYLRPVEESTTE